MIFITIISYQSIFQKYNFWRLSREKTKYKYINYKKEEEVKRNKRQKIVYKLYSFGLSESIARVRRKSRGGLMTVDSRNSRFREIGQPLMTVMTNHQYREIIPSKIIDTEQGANYVREHRRELK